jgi:hypothetical protein
MHIRASLLADLILGRSRVRAASIRQSRQANLLCESLEGRVAPAHGAVAHHALAPVHAAAHLARHQPPLGESDRDRAMRSRLRKALQTLQADVQAIELCSSTTIGQLAAIREAHRALASDGLAPSGASDLASFADSLVTAHASGTTLAGNASLLSQFVAIYTKAPTAQQKAQLTMTYNALAAAVTSANITSADIASINTDWAGVVAAKGILSTASAFPYFSLVTGGLAGSGGCNWMGRMESDLALEAPF